jgi:hypothetical protein
MQVQRDAGPLVKAQNVPESGFSARLANDGLDPFPIVVTGRDQVLVSVMDYGKRRAH